MIRRLDRLLCEMPERGRDGGAEREPLMGQFGAVSKLLLAGDERTGAPPALRMRVSEGPSERFARTDDTVASGGRRGAGAALVGVRSRVKV